MFGNRWTVWNVRAMPEPRDLVAARARRCSAPSKTDVALVGRVQPGDHVEQRALAGAVGPDDADDLALVDGEVEAVERVAGRRSASRPRGPPGGSSRSLAERARRPARRARPPSRLPAHLSWATSSSCSSRDAPDVRDQALRAQDHDRHQAPRRRAAAGTPRTPRAAPGARSARGRRRSTPGMLPMPPRITMASAVIETRTHEARVVQRRRSARRTAPRRGTRSPPPIANARSLNLMVLTPIASATCSSSRIAFHARPTREAARRHEM